MRIFFTILGAGVALAAGGMIVSASNAGLLETAAPARAATAAPTVTPAAAQAPNAFDFQLTAIDGKPMPMQAYRGQVVLLVNTASFCGFTPQYEGLQQLQDKYAARGFTVVGVPSGDFKSQEYDDNGKIREFCDAHFGITFPLAQKSVVTGARAIPLYRWVATQITANNQPQWNFHKFLIARDGRVIAGFASATTPQSPELTGAIEQALTA